MSYWRDVLLATSNLEEEGSEDCPSWPAIEDVNRWLVEHGWWALFKVENPFLTGHSPNCCWAGYFKNLDQNGFVAAVKEAPWRWPEQVQLFIRGEDGGFIECLHE